MTAYLILGQDPDRSVWQELATIDATSQESAIRKATDKHTGYSVFIAVPVRSWKPLKVERVQTVQMKLAEATPPKAPATSPKEDT